MEMLLQIGSAIAKSHLQSEDCTLPAGARTWADERVHPSPIALHSLSMVPRAREQWVMATLKAYLDDSGGDDQDSICVAGYVGDLGVWQVFEDEWQATLLRHSIPYFHMREICNPSSPMHRFCGTKAAGDLLNLLQDLVSVLGRASARGRFVGVGGLVPLADLRRFNSERRRKLDPVALALFVALAVIRRRYGPFTVEVLIDRVTKAEHKIAAARDHLATSPKTFHERGDVIVMPAAGEVNAKTVRPLQAADLAAYECFQKWKRLRPFYDEVDLTNATAQIHWYEYVNWIEREGRQMPDERASLTALGNATEFRCPILTYDVLCAEDDARGGVWTD